MNKRKLMSIFSIYRVVIIILIPLFIACDKIGNPKLSGSSFRCEINGVKYKDQMPMFIPPGAQRSPVIEHVIYNDDQYIQFSSSLTPEAEEAEQRGYQINFRIPMDGNVVLNQAYQFEPIESKEILEGIDNLLYLEGSKQFVRILSNGKYFYGEGTVVFTEFDLTEQKAMGKLKITFPYPLLDMDHEGLQLNGEFICWVKRSY